MLVSLVLTKEEKFDIASASGSPKTAVQLITIPSNVLCQASLELPTTLPAGPFNQALTHRLTRPEPECRHLPRDIGEWAQSNCPSHTPFDRNQRRTRIGFAPEICLIQLHP